MAHFYGGVHGHRGEATRLGTKRSGLSVFCNGWRIGVKASLYADESGSSDLDTITVDLTCGSGHSGESVRLGTFSRKDLEKMVAKARRKIAAVPA